MAGDDKLKVKRTETVSGTVASDNYEARVTGANAGGGNAAGCQECQQKAGGRKAG